MTEEKKYIDTISSISIDNFKDGNYPEPRKIQPYTLFSYYYDEIMDYLKYDDWYEYVILCAEFFSIKKKKLLEIASGTGHFGYLLSKNFNVTLSDNSVSMLTLVKSRYPEFKPILLDMKKFDLKKKFNIILNFNDNINYLLTDEELFSHFLCVKRHLKKSGMYLFDCTPYLNIKNNFSGKVIIKNIRDSILRWETTFNDTTGRIKARVDIYDIKSGKILREEHIQQIHQPQKIISLLKKAGFNKINHFNGFTLRPAHSLSLHYHFAILN